MHQFENHILCGLLHNFLGLEDFTALVVPGVSDGIEMPCNATALVKSILLSLPLWIPALTAWFVAPLIVYLINLLQGREEVRRGGGWIVLFDVLIV